MPHFEKTFMRLEQRSTLEAIEIWPPPLFKDHGGVRASHLAWIYPTRYNTWSIFFTYDKHDTKILKLTNDGKSLRQIAKQVGISHVVVKNRLDRLTAIETGNQTPPPDTGTAMGHGRIYQAEEILFLAYNSPAAKNPSFTWLW